MGARGGGLCCLTRWHPRTSARGPGCRACCSGQGLGEWAARLCRVGGPRALPTPAGTVPMALCGKAAAPLAWPLLSVVWPAVPSPPPTSSPCKPLPPGPLEPESLLTGGVLAIHPASQEGAITCSPAGPACLPSKALGPPCLALQGQCPPLSPGLLCPELIGTAGGGVGLGHRMEAEQNWPGLAASS